MTGVKKKINVEVVKMELETTSLVNLSKAYGYNKDAFREMLKARGIKSPRSSGQRVIKQQLFPCACGKKKMKGRNICNDCRNTMKREQRKAKKVQNGL